MTVYVLIAEAVYDQGCYGVFTRLEDAQSHAATLWFESDGHHVFRIERHTVGRGVAANHTIRGAHRTREERNRRRRFWYRAMRSNRSGPPWYLMPEGSRDG